MKIKIYTGSSEIEALLIKNYLESNDIVASIAPWIKSLGNNPYMRGPNIAHDVFVEEEFAESAKKIIAEMQTK